MIFFFAFPFLIFTCIFFPPLCRSSIIMIHQCWRHFATSTVVPNTNLFPFFLLCFLRCLFFSFIFASIWLYFSLLTSSCVFFLLFYGAYMYRCIEYPKFRGKTKHTNDCVILFRRHRIRIRLFSPTMIIIIVMCYVYEFINNYAIKTSPVTLHLMFSSCKYIGFLFCHSSYKWHSSIVLFFVFFLFRVRESSSISARQLQIL